MKKIVKKLQNKYLSPYANRNFETLVEWQNLIDIAEKYGDSGYAIQQAAIPSSFLAKRLLQLGFYNGELALDLGCGYGQWTIPLGILNEKAIGVDLNTKRVEIAKELAVQSLKQPTVVEFMQGQAERLDEIQDGSVDFVYCYGVFMFLNQQNSLAEISRVLKPGGRLYICTNSYGWWLYLAMRRGFTNRHIMFSSLKALILGSRGTPSSLSRSGLSKVLSNAGFEEIVVDLEGRINSTENMNTYKSRFLYLPMCIESTAVKPKNSNTLNVECEFTTALFKQIEECKPLELGIRDLIFTESNLISPEVARKLTILNTCRDPLQQISDAHRFIAESIIHDLRSQPLTASQNIPQNLSINLGLKSGRCGSKARALADLLVLLGWKSGIIVTGHHVNTWVEHQGEYAVLDCDIYSPGHITYPGSQRLIPINSFLHQDPRLNSITNSYHYLLDTNRNSLDPSKDTSDSLIALPSTLLNSQSGEVTIYERAGSKDLFREVIKTQKRSIVFLDGLPSLQKIGGEIHIQSSSEGKIGLYGTISNLNVAQRISDLIYIGDFQNRIMSREMIPVKVTAVTAVPNDYLLLNPGLLTNLVDVN